MKTVLKQFKVTRKKPHYDAAFLFHHTKATKLNHKQKPHFKDAAFVYGKTKSLNHTARGKWVVARPMTPTNLAPMHDHINTL